MPRFDVILALGCLAVTVIVGGPQHNYGDIKRAAEQAEYKTYVADKEKVKADLSSEYQGS